MTPTAARLRGHGGPVRALAVAADGKTVLSGGFDTSAILWDLQRGVAEQVLRLHDGAVNGVAFLPDGKAVVSAAYDGAVRIWPLPQPAAPIVVELPAPLNALLVAPDGEIATGGADGRIYFLSAR